MLGRSQEAYDRFSAAVDGPLTVLAGLGGLAATGDDQALRCIR
jgi:hypothetical protein